jgi:hypothetical protein
VAGGAVAVSGANGFFGGCPRYGFPCASVAFLAGAPGRHCRRYKLQKFFARARGVGHCGTLAGICASGALRRATRRQLRRAPLWGTAAGPSLVYDVERLDQDTIATVRCVHAAVRAPEKGRGSARVTAEWF